MPVPAAEAFWYWSLVSMSTTPTSSCEVSERCGDAPGPVVVDGDDGLPPFAGAVAGVVDDVVDGVVVPGRRPEPLLVVGGVVVAGARMAWSDDELSPCSPAPPPTSPAAATATATRAPIALRLWRRGGSGAGGPGGGGGGKSTRELAGGGAHGPGRPPRQSSSNCCALVSSTTHPSSAVNPCRLESSKRPTDKNQVWLDLGEARKPSR